VYGVGVDVGQQPGQLERQVLVEEQPQTA
jgi:hypothetical protein